MKTFDDLEFKPHQAGEGLQARIDFPNDYGISVVRFSVLGRVCSYTSGPNEWEVAIMKDGQLCYDTPITNDVIGHCTKEDVTRIMKEIQELK